MPWLDIVNKTAKQQKQLFELLDTARPMHNDNYMSKLYDLQNTDGGLTWFAGGKSNVFISNYVLAGFGKLKQDSLLIPKNSFEGKYLEFIKKLLRYCNRQFINEREGIGFPVARLYHAYANSFWKDDHSPADSSFIKIKDVLRQTLNEA